MIAFEVYFVALDNVLNAECNLFDEKVELILQLIRGNILALRLVDVVGGAEKKGPSPDRGIGVGCVDDNRDVAACLLDLLQEFQPSENPLPAQCRHDEIGNDYGDLAAFLIPVQQFDGLVGGFHGVHVKPEAAQLVLEHLPHEHLILDKKNHLVRLEFPKFLAHPSNRRKDLLPDFLPHLGFLGHQFVDSPVILDCRGKLPGLIGKGFVIDMADGSALNFLFLNAE